MSKPKLSIYIDDPETIALLRELQKELSRELCGQPGIPCRLEKGEKVIPFKYLIGIIVKNFAQSRELLKETGGEERLSEIDKMLEDIKRTLGE